MANYCYGDMTVKGTKENVLNFLHKALIPVTATGKLLNINPVKKINAGFIKLITRNANNNYHSMWIKNSNNSFLNSANIPILNDNENNYQVNLSVEFAWFADSNNIKNLAKEYNVNINVDVTEENNEFRQIINADNKGTLLKDIEINIHDNPNTNKSTSDFANNYKIINNFFQKKG
jgi:hypothetical protein